MILIPSVIALCDALSSLICYRDMEEEVICILCSATSHLKFNIKGFIQHIQLFHAHQADFHITCGIEGCQRSYTNCGTFLTTYMPYMVKVPKSFITEWQVRESDWSWWWWLLWWWQWIWKPWFWAKWHICQRQSNTVLPRILAEIFCHIFTWFKRKV